MKALILTLLLALISRGVLAEVRQYPKDKLTGDEVFQLCTLIKKGRDESVINANIIAMADRRGLSPADFVNNTLAKESCGSLGPEGGTVVTQAMYYQYYNLEPFFKNGWDLKRKIRDFDGVLREPLEIAWRKLLRAEKSGAGDSAPNKVHWGRVFSIMLRSPQGKDQLGDGYIANVRERTNKEFVQDVLAQAGALPADRLTQPELNTLCSVGQVRLELLTQSMLARGQSLDTFVNQVLSQVQCNGTPYSEENIKEFRETHSLQR